MSRYFTIVIRADDETGAHSARQLTPGERIGGAVITACSLGDAITLNDKFKEMIPAYADDAVSRLEQADIAPHFKSP